MQVRFRPPGLRSVAIVALLLAGLPTGQLVATEEEGWPREIEELDAAGQAWEEGALAEAQGRICKPEEVAAAVVFLASDEASFITGNALYVDNGWYAKG